MQLEEIYQPIKKELDEVEQMLRPSLNATKSKFNSISEINNYLLNAECKRLRPALVIFAAKATCGSKTLNYRLTKIATAIELIHIASLIHDDVIDHALLRHSQPTINAKWGQDVSIALGDYLYSVAFELISDCGNPDIIRCISQATKSMCEGELLQVLERDNLDLLKEQYIVIVKKKTASLFAASCRVGAVISDSKMSLQRALKEYGLNFGIVFQIIDDYLDLVSEEQTLGKSPGQDIACGEITLPILHLWESISKQEKGRIKDLLTCRRNKEALKTIKTRFFDSGATTKTKVTILSFINSAKEKISILSHSPYKQSLLGLADFIVERTQIKT